MAKGKDIKIRKLNRSLCENYPKVTFKQWDDLNDCILWLNYLMSGSRRLRQRIHGGLSHQIFCQIHSHNNYTVSQKKGATLTMAMTLSILDRFAKFFHCCKQQ